MILGLGVLDVASEGGISPPVRMAMARPMPSRPLTRKIGCARVGRAAVTFCDVAQTDRSAVHDEAHVKDVLLGSGRAKRARRIFSSPVCTTRAGMTAFLGLEAAIAGLSQCRGR